MSYFVYNIYNADKTTRSYNHSADGYALALKAGEVIYLHVYSGNYTVSVKSRENTTLSTTATPVTVKNGEEKWFVFTAPETGDYTFKSEGATAAVKADYYTSIQDKNASYDSPFGPSGDSKDFAFTKTLTKDSTIAIRVYTDEETATANISVAPKETKKVSLGTPETVNVKKGESQWFTFPVTEDGLYSFDISGASNEDYYKNGIAYNNRISNTNVELKAGDIIYIRVTAPSGNTGLVGAGEAADTVAITIKVTKLEASLITAGTPATMTLSDNSEHWFVFTAPEYGRYTFSTAVTANATGDSHAVSSVKRYNKVGGTITDSYFGASAEKVLKAGEEVVLKITADAVATTGVTTSASITVAKINFEAFTNEASLALGKDAVKWYSFTAPKDATYTFKKDVTAGTVDLYAATAITENFNLISSDSAGYDLKAGNTVYFKAEQTSGETASAGNITVSVPTATEFTETTGAVALKKDVPQWFKFTAPKTARYTVAASVAEETASVTVELHKALEGSALSLNADGNFFEAGETVYFKLTTDADTATTTLSVKPIATVELTAGTLTDVTVKDGADKWYQFTAPANGRYALSLTINDGSTGINADVYTDNATAKVNAGFPDNEYLKSGTTYYVRVYTSETTDQSGKLEVKAIPVTGTLSLAEPTKVDLKAGVTSWYTFTAPESGIYHFDATDVAADINLTVEAYKNKESESTASDIPFSYKLNKDEIVSIALSADKDASFNVKVAKTAQIKVGETAVTLKKGEDKYFSFKPYSAGRYAIKSAGVLPEGAKIAIDGGDFSAYGFFESVYCTSEQDTYEFSVSTDSETDVTFNIVIERLLPTENELTLDKPLALTIGKNAEQYVTFTAPKDGRYFIKSNNDKVTVTLKECDSTGEDIGTPKTLPSEVLVPENTTKLYKVTYTSTETAASATFNLSVSPVEPKAITVSDEAKAVEFKADDNRWMVFTADKTGKYTFEFTKESESPTVYLYKNIAEDIHEVYSGKECTVAKGDSLYFKLGETGAVTLQAKVTLKEELTALTVGENSFDTTDATANKNVYFTAAQTGVYKFTLSADDYILYSQEADSSTKNNYYSSYGSLGYVLNVGDSIWFTVNPNNRGTLKVEQTASSVDVLSENVEKNMSVNPTDFQYLSFTASEYGSYNFALSDNCTVYCYWNPD